jgi:cytochrome o ubiquinol oxidase subunit II
MLLSLYRKEAKNIMSLHGHIKFTTFGKLAALLLLLFSLFSLAGCQMQYSGMLSPKGLIAYEERKLFFDTLALMLIVVLPVIVMSITFVYHYQQSHKIRDYMPDWSHNYFLEALWWCIPCAIIVILSFLTWKKTHQLDPYKAIITPHQTLPLLSVKVIALPWNWLFIYPDYDLATLNYLIMPLDRPVEFILTADNVPMSAFFIPQLGSQIYVMAGMRTRLNLLANHSGRLEGMNTQYNGIGFAAMHFPVDVMTQDDMQKWAKSMRKSALPMTPTSYQQLLLPSIGAKPQTYKNISKTLFEDVLNLYMHSDGTVHPRNQFNHVRQETESRKGLS